MTRKSDFTRALAGLALVAAAAVATLQAATGDIPIYQPTTITQPGHYVVTRDIASTGGSVKRGLTIRNGRLQGNVAGTGHAIHGFGANLEVRIQDLEIANFDGDGVRFDSVRFLEVARCHIHDVGLGLDVNFAGSTPFKGVILELAKTCSKAT